MESNLKDTFQYDLLRLEQVNKQIGYLTELLREDKDPNYLRYINNLHQSMLHLTDEVNNIVFSASVLHGVEMTKNCIAEGEK